jgi:hypothetical protein
MFALSKGAKGQPYAVEMLTKNHSLKKHVLKNKTLTQFIIRNI